MLDPSLHSLQLLNLAAVVFDLSFELQRLYLLVSNRPLLMVVILGVALGVEWLLERYEEEDNAASGTQRGGFARIGRSVGRVLLPGVMGVLIACVGWLLLSAVLLHPTALVAPAVQYIERRVGGSSACASISDCLLITGSTFQACCSPPAPPPLLHAPPSLQSPGLDRERWTPSSALSRSESAAREFTISAAPHTSVHKSPHQASTRASPLSRAGS